MPHICHALPRSLAATGLLAAGALIPNGTRAQLTTSAPATFVALTVEVYHRAGGVKQAVSATTVCIGSSRDPQAYGKWLTNGSGQVAFDSVPLGSAVYVTAQGKQIFALGGDVQGARVNYVAKAAGLVLPIELAVSSQPGPTCSTPIGQEPAPIPSKPLPSPATAMPTIASSLLATPNPVVIPSTVAIHTAGSSSQIAVTGAPTHYALVNSDGTMQPWIPVSTTGYNTIAGISVTPPQSAGVHQLALKVKNALGESPVYPVAVTVVDLRPCVLRLTQRDSPSSVAQTSTGSTTIQRTKTHGWAGDGRWVTLFENTGPHPLTIGFFQAAPSDGSSVGPVSEMTLQSGAWNASTTPLRNIVYAKCP